MSEGAHCPRRKVVGLLTKCQGLQGKGTVRDAERDLINQIS